MNAPERPTHIVVQFTHVKGMSIMIKRCKDYGINHFCIQTFATPTLVLKKEDGIPLNIFSPQIETMQSWYAVVDTNKKKISIEALERKAWITLHNSTKRDLENSN